MSEKENKITLKKKRRKTRYASINFKTKKQFKEAVARGDKITLFAPGLGEPKKDGVEFVEGPHYPKPHTWYAQVSMDRGFVTKVK